MPDLEAIIVENPSVDGPFGAKAIGEMANNAQAPAICAAIHDALGVWVTEQPATPERVLRALEAKKANGQPRRDGKRVIFDEAISVTTVAPGTIDPHGHQCPLTPSSPFRTWNGVERTEFVPGIRIKAIGGEQVCVCHVVYEAGKQVPLHIHEHTEQVMVITEGECTVTVEGVARRSGGRRLRHQPRDRALGVLGERRHLLRGARAGTARPHPGQAARPRARPRRRQRPRRALKRASTAASPSSRGRAAASARRWPSAWRATAITSRWSSAATHRAPSRRPRRWAGGRRCTGPDLADPDAAAAVVDAVVAAHGRLDALVLNAGTIDRHDAIDFPLDVWRRTLDLNLTSPFLLAQAAARSFRAQGSGGRIVFISSVLAFQGGIRVPAYAATKGAVRQLVMALANEWARRASA